MGHDWRACKWMAVLAWALCADAPVLAQDAAALEDEGCQSLTLSKELGATDVQHIERPAWHWMGR